MGEALAISIENLKHGWVDVRVSKGTQEYCMPGVSYVTDFTGDLALAALGFLFRPSGDYGVRLDGEGIDWVLRLTRSETEFSQYLLECGRCDGWRDSKLLLEGGDLIAVQSATARFRNQTDFFSVQVDQSEFGYAVMTALQRFESASAENGVIPCDMISQVNRPIAALASVMAKPFKAYSPASEIIAIVNILPSNDPAKEQIQ